MILHSCEEYYAWDPNACVCECGKDCDMGEYLKNCEYIISHAECLVAISIIIY